MDNHRDPRFELHIVPMMRLLDCEQMILARGLDLWDYDQVVAKAQEISHHLRRDMPPKPYGGLWPIEWVQLFDRWMNTGFKRLILGKPLGDYHLSHNGNELMLEAETELPDESYETWFDQAVDKSGQLTFTLYWQDPDTPLKPPLTPRSAIAGAKFSVPPQSKIIIVDIHGRQELIISSIT